jgi:hypothetical protein
MPNYDLDRLGDQQFEHLVQALLKAVIGPGTITFGPGPDGGREATFSGKAAYPSSRKGWKGEWIFQAKFHNVRQIGPDKARQQLLIDLKKELEKIVIKYKRKCDNYILVTNVPLSSVPNVGTHDKIASEVVPEFLVRVPHIHVWGYDDVARLLDNFPQVRQPYFHLLTPGDLIAELMSRVDEKKSLLAETAQLYVRTSFDTEQYSQLDQAGDVGEKPIPLRRVFIDLEVMLRSKKDATLATEAAPELQELLSEIEDDESVSACRILIQEQVPRAVLIGGPGQGKSTLGQFIAQIHRAHLLQKLDQIPADITIVPVKIRVPFRIILKDYAQWIAEATDGVTLERYLSGLMAERAGREVSAEDVQLIFKNNPCLLILDGLDEVTDDKLRTKMLQLVSGFVARAETLKADLQVLATSRQTGYSDQFDPANYLHFVLVGMDRSKVLEYTDKWVHAKGLDSAKAQLLKAAVKDCIEDRNFAPLMNTPLQVTIFILIILNGGTPPRQREELFDEYLEVIYKRERAKSKTIIQTEKRLLFGLHEYMGYILHRRAAESADLRSRLKLEEFSAEVFRYLRQQDPFTDQAKLQKIADQLIKEAHERLVLLVELEAGFFGFELRSIQEFFAAAYLADTASDNKQRFSRFMSVALPPHWHNVALFFAGRVGRSYPGEAAQILEVCREIDRNVTDRFIRRGAWLCLDIAVDRSFGPARMLQRSAIEYGLSILDEDLDSDGVRELISRLNQLPKDDITQHVIPVLEKRISRGLNLMQTAALDVYVGVAEKKTYVEKTLAAVAAEENVDYIALLRKALEYNLTQNFITDHVGKHLATAQEDALLPMITSEFISNPRYISSVLKALNVDAALAKRLFDDALEAFYAPQHRRITSITSLLSRPSDVWAQSAVAWEVVSEIQQLRHSGRAEFARTVSGHALDQLSRAALDSQMLLSLRASYAGLAILSWLYNHEEATAMRYGRRFQQSIDEMQAEYVERLFLRIGIPSLELMESVTRSSDFIRLFTSESWPRYRKSRAPLGLLSIIILITDALPIDEVREIAAISDDNGNLSKELVNWKLGQRLGGFSIGQPPPLPLRILASILDHTAGLLVRPSDAEWRGWECLIRLGVADWNVKSEGGEILRIAVERLISIIKARKIEDIGCWRLANLLAVIAQIPGLESATCELLSMVPRMNDEVWGRPYAWILSDGQTLRHMLELAQTRDECVRGFMKLYPVYAYSAARSRSENTSPFTAKHAGLAATIANQENGAVRYGAVILLSETGLKNSRVIHDLLERCREGEPRLHTACGRLIRATAASMKSKDSISFLEGVLSRTPPYSRSARMAALYHLRQSTKEVSGEIPESMLGLPFQAAI